MNELINKDSEWIIHFMGSLDRVGTAESEPPDTSGLPERRAHSLYPVRR